MNDFYNKYRGELAPLTLLPECIDAACDELMQVGEPREAVQLLKSIDQLPEPQRSESRSSLVWLLNLIPRPGRFDDAPADDDHVDDDVLEIVEAQHPDGDPKPIARLLKRGVPMPDWVGRDLGVMLDPSDAYRGNKLTVKTNNGEGWRDILSTQIAKRKAGDRFRSLRELGQ